MNIIEDNQENATMSIHKPKAILISLGGTPAPLIFSLNHQKPDYICFFVSEESKESINKDILPELDFKPKHHYWIVTPSAESLSECYRAISRELPRILRKWQININDLNVDYTGGTKTMSVAVALATVENTSHYSYVGGTDRSKQGVGVVLNGKERMWYLENPWDEMAVLESKEASALFNRARYASAVEIFSQISRKVSEKNRPVFKALTECSEGYNLWDNFQHKLAKNKLYRCRDVLVAYASGSDKKNIHSLVDSIKTNLQFLDQIVIDSEKRGLFLCYDLIANARRRADLEHKYDDAVARLYRALEALAQHRLDFKHGIKTSNVDQDRLPAVLKEEYKRRYFDGRQNKMKLPLYASYQLLKELNDELGHNFFRQYDDKIKPILDLRNSSLLAHGFNSVKKETYQKMYAVLLDFTGIEQEALPEYPALNL